MDREHSATGVAWWPSASEYFPFTGVTPAWIGYPLDDVFKKMRFGQVGTCRYSFRAEAFFVFEFAETLYWFPAAGQGREGDGPSHILFAGHAFQFNMA